MNKKAIAIAISILLLAVVYPCLAQTGGRQKRPLPYEYGRVVIDNYSEQAGLAPVVFEHWIHRTKFTCRVCHLDLGFAMKAGETGITASDNAGGYYCGTCHDGKRVFAEGKTAFQACSKVVTEEDRKRCDRCHSWGKEVKSDFDFFAFAALLPRGRLGNGIDWMAAEELGLVKPASSLDGVFGPFAPYGLPEPPADFALHPPVTGLPNIIFSHEKHAAWNGCALCHLDIFTGRARELIQYTTVENFHARLCGVCHTNVAFPRADCQRCHSEPAQF
jgi:c(7)-type cytochrome triheme protein